MLLPVASALISLAVFIHFGYLAYHVVRRNGYVLPQSKRANLAFGLFWASLGASYLFVAASTFSAALGAMGPAVYLEYANRALTIFIAGSWFYFVLFLLLGNELMSGLLTGGLSVGLVAWTVLALRSPILTVPRTAPYGPWGVEFVSNGAPAVWFISIIAVLGVFSAVALARLFAAAVSPSTRYRIGVTALALLICSLGSIEEMTGIIGIPFIYARLAVWLAGVVAYVAYFPPKPMRIHFGLKDLRVAEKPR